MKAIDSQPSGYHTSNSDLPNFIPKIGLSCHPKKGTSIEALFEFSKYSQIYSFSIQAQITRLQNITRKLIPIARSATSKTFLSLPKKVAFRSGKKVRHRLW